MLWSVDARIGRLAVVAAVFALVAACSGSSGAVSPPQQQGLPRSHGPQSLKANFANGPYTAASDFDPNTNTLSVLDFPAPVSIPVSLANLDVDLDCAREFTWTGSSQFRIALLRSGCGVIVDHAAATNEERGAEDEARAANRKRWTPYPAAEAGSSPDSSGSWSLADVGGFLGDNWDKILGIILGFLGLSWVAAKIDKVRKGKKIDVVLTGLKSVGKTDLWKAWENEMAPESNSAPTVGTQTSRDPEPIPFGRYTIYPQIVDTAGSDPSLVVQQLQNKRVGAKNVLLIVLSPTPSNEPPSIGSGYDSPYVQEQQGFLNFPRALIGPTGSLKPSLVVIFLSKFDLFSREDPNDTSSKKAKEEVERVFGEHKKAVEIQCKKADVPFVWIIGSAKKGWGVQRLRREVTTRVVMKK